jgi:hypothetical protein
MKFNITGRRTRRIVIEIEEEIEECDVDVLKKDVLDALDLPAKVDGDPTHWYGEVEQALSWGCPSKIIGDPVSKTERTVKVVDDWEVEYLDW